jgi:hypothetical protein
MASHHCQHWAKRPDSDEIQLTQANGDSFQEEIDSITKDGFLIPLSHSQTPFRKYNDQQKQNMLSRTATFIGSLENGKLNLKDNFFSTLLSQTFHVRFSQSILASHSTTGLTSLWELTIRKEPVLSLEPTKEDCKCGNIAENLRKIESSAILLCPDFFVFVKCNSFQCGSVSCGHIQRFVLPTLRLKFYLIDFISFTQI